MKAHTDSAWSWLWFGISAGILAVILGVGVVAVALPRVTGAVPLTVLSPSMSPALPKGTMLIVRPIEAAQLHEIRKGDVISFLPNPDDPTLITHRVTEIISITDGDFIFHTQGDANSLPDAPVRGKQVRAVLWYSLPGLGWVNDLINAQGNRSWIVPAAAGALFAYAGYTGISSAVTSAKKRRAAAPTAQKGESP